MKNFILFLPFNIILVGFLFQGLQGNQHIWWFGRNVISLGSGHVNLKWQGSIITAYSAKPNYEKGQSLDSIGNRFFDLRAILPYYSTPPGDYSLRIPLWIPILTIFFISFMFRSKKSDRPRP